VKVRWTDKALDDRVAIWEYLTERNPAAAVALDKRFSESVALLAENPLMGLNGQIAGTRELVPHEHYRLIYELD